MDTIQFLKILKELRDTLRVVKSDGEPGESKGFTPGSDQQMGVSTVRKLLASTPSDWYVFPYKRRGHRLYAQGRKICPGSIQ